MPFLRRSRKAVALSTAPGGYSEEDPEKIIFDRGTRLRVGMSLKRGLKEEAAARIEMARHAWCDRFATCPISHTVRPRTISGASWRAKNVERLRANVVRCGARHNAGERIEILKRANDEPAPDALVLTAMHSSKGLEWDHVWITRAEENVVPDQKSPESEERRLFMWP